MIANVCVCVCVVFFIARVPLFSCSPLSLCPLRQHVNRMCAPWLMRVYVCVRVCVCCPHLLGLFQVECLKQASKAASKMVGAKKKVCNTASRGSLAGVPRSVDGSPLACSLLSAAPLFA